MKNKILSILLLALATLTASAQDDFNPTLPGEPNAQYKVTVGISPAAAGTVYGGGSYATGQQVTISRQDAYVSSTATTFYKFSHWTLNGSEYEPAGKSSSFIYNIGTENAAFEAVYEEQDPDEVTSRLYLVAEPADACTFDRASGERYWEDNYVYLYYNPTSSAFRFLGWYDENGMLVSSDDYFNHYIGPEDATLTARFAYDPSIPGEPENQGQDDVANGILGDVNGDKEVTVSDAVATMNYYLRWTVPSGDDARYDVNRDGQITVTDAITTMNIYLTTK